MNQHLFDTPLTGKIAIVGNGEVSSSLCQQIEAANHIIRFNNPSIAMLGESARTDILVISNSSKQTKKLLNSQSYILSPAFSGAKIIILPYHPNIIKQYMPKPSLFSYMLGARADQTKLCIQACQKAGKQFYILTPESYFDTCKIIGIGRDKLRAYFPSSGIMMIHAITRQLDMAAHIDIYGFSFEGWKRHDWGSEREYITRISANKQIYFWQ